MLEGKGNYGFDAARKQYVDLVEAGIIDPTKVVRIALESPISRRCNAPAQCERSEHRPVCRRRSRVTPPRTHSRSRLWP